MTFHLNQVAKLAAELEAGNLSEMEVEAIEWAISRHKAILAKNGVFAI